MEKKKSVSETTSLKKIWTFFNFFQRHQIPPPHQEAQKFQVPV